MRGAQQLLSLINKAYPPNEHMRHFLSIDEEGRLVLDVSMPNGRQSGSFSEDDLDREVTELLNEIAEQLDAVDDIDAKLYKLEENSHLSDFPDE